MDVERKLTSIRFIKLSYLYNLKYQKKILAHMNLNIVDDVDDQLLYENQR